MNHPELVIRSGTAYDLFVSLYIIYSPGEFGLRAAWAAGVRSRISPGPREALRLAMPIMAVPFLWLHELDGSPDCSEAIRVLEETAASRLPHSLVFGSSPSSFIGNRLSSVASSGAWDSGDADALEKAISRAGRRCTRASIEAFLELWKSPTELGSSMRQGLREYHESFFTAEEKRIRKPVQKAAEILSAEIAGGEVSGILSRITGGMEETLITRLRRYATLYLIPSFWITPGHMTGSLDDTRGVLLTHARPPGVSLVPGEPVPESVRLMLQGLNDDTRQRILKLTHENGLTQTEIAGELRLRPPTITHHLKILRLAGLIAQETDEGGEKRYTSRLDRLQSLFEELLEFLSA